MFEAPPAVPAVCELRTDLNEARGQCAIIGQVQGDKGAICFAMKQDFALCFGGTIKDDGLLIEFGSVNGADPVQIDGVCLTNQSTRRVGCLWYRGGSEFVLVAQY